MSIGGPSSLGTLLIQRLDAVLGLHTSQQTNLANGARADAVSQARQAGRPERAENTATRSTRQSVDNVQAQQQPAKGRIGTAPSTAANPAASAAQGRGPSSTSTTLGRTAQLILTLLDQYPGPAPAIQGRQVLLPSLPPAPPPQTAASPQGSSTPETASPEPSAHRHLNTSRPALPDLLQAAVQSLPKKSQALLQTAQTQPNAPSALAQYFSLALQHSTQQSGLFYESHLAQWTSGQHDLALLKQEPQNQPSPSQHAHEPLKATHAPESHHLLIRQQLETLGTQSFTWSGQAWQDCELEWTVQKYPDHDPSAAAEHWHSNLTLHLPTLGTVQLRIQLNQQQLQVDIQSAEQADFLRAHSELVKQRLHHIGMHLSQLHIQDSATNSHENPDVET